MSFIDKKEEVIRIQLTQFGKELLSRGKFKPTYYSFHDDEVMYDAKYSDKPTKISDEKQKDIVPRIKSTVQSDVLYMFEGAETRMKMNKTNITSANTEEARMLQGVIDKNYALPLPLGTSSLKSVKYPAFSIRMLAGDIKTKFDEDLEATVADIGKADADERAPYVSIPQINCENIKYETRISGDNVTSDPNNAGGPGELSDLSLASLPFPDGTFIEVKEDQIVLEVNEEYVDLRKDNYDIEVYSIEEEVTKSGETKERLVPLTFGKKRPMVVDDLLIDDNKVDQPYELTPDMVSYYFNVFVDREIDQDLLCALGASASADSIYSRALDCPDLRDVPSPLDPASAPTVPPPVCDPCEDV